MLPSQVSPRYPSVDWTSPRSCLLDTSNFCTWDQTRHLPPQTCSFSGVTLDQQLYHPSSPPNGKLGSSFPLCSPSGNHKCILCEWVCFCYLEIPSVSDHTWYLFFSFWLASLGMIIPSSTHIAALFHSFSWLSSIPSFVPHLLYPFI